MKFIACMALSLSSISALSAGRFESVKIDDALQTKISYDSVNLGKSPNPQEPSFSANLIQSPQSFSGTFEGNGPICGEHKREMLSRALAGFERILHENIEGTLTALYQSMGLEIVELTINLPFLVNNVGYRSYFNEGGPETHATYEFSIDTYDFATGRRGNLEATVKSSDGKIRVFEVVLKGLELHLSNAPSLVLKYNELGDVISERKTCRFAVKFWRDESRYGFGAIYARDTGQRITGLSLPYILVDERIDVP